MVTGIGPLDQAIDGFLFEEIWDEELGCVVVSDLADPETACGLCDRAAASFNSFCEQYGLEATMTPFLASPDELGYTDRPVKGGGVHFASIVKHAGDQLMVDWTAAQYGYHEFPLIQRRVNGVWQRETALPAAA